MKLVNKYMNKNSLIRSSFIQVLTVIIIILIGSSAILYVNTVKSIENKFDVLNYEDTKKISNLSDMLLKEIETSIINASTDLNIQTYIYADNPGEIFADMNTRVASWITSLQGAKTYIDSVYVYSDKRKSIFADKTDYAIEDFTDNDCVKNFSQMPSVRAWSREKSKTYPHVISIMLKISQSGDTGAVIINIDTLKFVNNLISFGNMTEFYIIGDNGRIIYSGITQDIAKNISDMDYKIYDSKSIDSDGRRISKSKLKSQYYDWSYINVNTANQYVDEVNSVLKKFAAMLLCFILMGTIIAYVYAINSSKPIKSMISIMENPGGINSVQKLKHSEVQHLARNIIMMMDSNKQLKTELNDMISRTNKAHSLLLQAQINPHFLYNTLNVINWMVEDETPEGSRSSDMIIGLSTLLRASIDFKNILIPLKSEIEYTKIYISIMKNRYKNPFEVLFDFEDEILDKPVIKLFMQPMIENSIVHGFRNMEGEGIIKITGIKNNDFMIIKISDNGKEIDDVVLSKINKKFDFEEIYTDKSIGLKNVKFRLDTIWGDRASLYVEKNHGTVITIRIPIS